MHSSEKKKSGGSIFVIYTFLAPLAWACLSILIFSILGPKIPEIIPTGIPRWVWLWILQMTLVIPFWIWLFRKNLYEEQTQFLKIFKVKLSLGRPTFYLAIAYISAILSLFFHDRWFGKWLVFGGIVSPIFEELFSRNLITPWLKTTWKSFLLVSVISSISFSLMHWGFNGMNSFDLPIAHQIQKFLSHFLFGMILCVIFRFTKSIQILIWIHIASNLPFILSKLE